MHLRQISDFITQSLSLTNSPVALSFQDSTPAGVPLFNAAVPSSCTFWIRAEEQLFFAPAVLHENCPVGMLTMGFPLNAQVMSTLDEFVSKMCAASYLSPSEAGSIPRVSSSGAGILYGPLSLFSSTPDITLLWVNARQAMLLEESVGAICWDRTEKAAAFGRPACAALAIAINSNSSTLSLGCSGMRTFTGVTDDKLLVSVPGSRLESLVEGLRTVTASNQEMLTFYQAHSARFAM